MGSTSHKPSPTRLLTLQERLHCQDRTIRNTQMFSQQPAKGWCCDWGFHQGNLPVHKAVISQQEALGISTIHQCCLFQPTQPLLMKYQGHCYPFCCRTTHANMHSLSVQLSTCPTAQLWQTTTSAVWNLCFMSHMWKLNRSKAYGQGYYSFRSLNIMWVCPLQSPEFSTFTLDRPSIEQLYTFSCLKMPCQHSRPVHFAAGGLTVPGWVKLLQAATIVLRVPRTVSL